MGVEDEFGIGHKQIAAIIHHFHAADMASTENADAFRQPLESYLDKIGPINFALIETIFRENGFNAYLVGIPSSIIEALDPDVMVADPNDVHFRDRVTPMPFSIAVCFGLEKAQQLGEALGFNYDPEENLLNLQRTGRRFTREELGMVNPVFAPGIPVVRAEPFRLQPKGSRRQAKWN